MKKLLALLLFPLPLSAGLPGSSIKQIVEVCEAGCVVMTIEALAQLQERMRLLEAAVRGKVECL